MPELTEADSYLLQQLRQGRAEGWSQFIDRYQGRMLAFTRVHIHDSNTAEDLVQESFIGFLQNLHSYRALASLETFLFTILRRRIVDHLRGEGRRRRIASCSLNDVVPDDSDHTADHTREIATAREPSASWYAIRSEDIQRQEDLLWQALWQIVERLRQELRLDELKICECIFYAQLRNQQIAALMGIDEAHVARVKFRFLKRLSAEIPADDRGNYAEDESLLTRVWEANRPSCLKRSTWGKLCLHTLESPWREYAEFHVDTLGCRFCRANLDDVRSASAELQDASHRSLRERIMQSSIGFFG